MRVHKNAMTMWPTLRHVQARFIEAQAPCSTSTPTTSATTENMTYGQVITSIADTETTPKPAITYIIARQTINSTDKTYSTSNTTVVVIFVVICTLSIVLSLCYFRRQWKDKKELAGITGEGELVRQNSELPIRPIVYASNLNNVGGFGVRAFYGDQIFRHELDGSGIEKGERYGNGGGNGSVDRNDTGTDSGTGSGGGSGGSDSDDEEVKAPTVYTETIP